MRGENAPWAATTYVTGIACPYCGVKANERCKTKSDYPFTGLAHKKRRDAARTANVVMTKHEPDPPPLPEPGEMGRMEGLKLALWYVATAGGIERARALLDAVAGAVAQVPDPKAVNDG